MKGFIFVLLFMLPIFGEAQFDCDSTIVSTVASIFNKNQRSIIHRCLHIQSMEKIITVVERGRDLGALSLFVFDEPYFSKNSQPLSKIESFSVDGLQSIDSQGLGAFVKEGIHFFYKKGFREGVLVLYFKNENNFDDVSLLRLTDEGVLKNFNFSFLKSPHLAIAQTGNMDLFVFKVGEFFTVDVLPVKNKLIITNKFDKQDYLEIDLGEGRLPASQVNMLKNSAEEGFREK